MSLRTKTPYRCDYCGEPVPPEMKITLWVTTRVKCTGYEVVFINERTADYVPSYLILERKKACPKCYITHKDDKPEKEECNNVASERTPS